MPRALLNPTPALSKVFWPSSTMAAERFALAVDMDPSLFPGRIFGAGLGSADWIFGPYGLFEKRQGATTRRALINDSEKGACVRDGGSIVLAFRRSGRQTSSVFGGGRDLPYLSGPLRRIRMPGASPLVNSMPAASSADWMDARLEP
jgi:hypothetical protein